MQVSLSCIYNLINVFSVLGETNLISSCTGRRWINMGRLVRGNIKGNNIILTNIIIFWSKGYHSRLCKVLFLCGCRKNGSVGPVQLLINLVSPYESRKFLCFRQSVLRNQPYSLISTSIHELVVNTKKNVFQFWITQRNEFNYYLIQIQVWLF